jgi:hypothetical protein
MICLLTTETAPAGVVEAAAPPADGQSSHVQRLDPAAAASEAPQLRERLLRLIVEREAKRKLQRSG